VKRNLRVAALLAPLSALASAQGVASAAPTPADILAQAAALVGLAILGGVLLLVAVTLYGSVRRRLQEARQQKLALELFEQRARLDLAAMRIDIQRRELAWNGLRKFRIERKFPEAEGVCSFYLTPHDRKPIPPFLAGQHLTFQLRIAGELKPVVRCYSLSDSPTQRDHYRVTIKLRRPPNHPGGPFCSASSYFHSLNPGDLVDVRAPSGNFHLDLAGTRPVVFIAGGIGITPLMSMLNAICETGSKREAWVFYGVTNRRRHLMYDHLQRLAREHRNVRLFVCYSDPGEDCVRGRDYDEKGRIDVDLLRRVLPSNNYEFFICGPPAMMESISASLRDWAVGDSDIRVEAFGSASVKSRISVPGVAQNRESRSAQVVFARCAVTANWTEGDGSLLDIAEANGVRIDSGCRAGNCGTCETAIRSGEVRHPIVTGFRSREGCCLPCVAVPQGSVVLDA
jgi:uncharacterized protein